MRKNAVQPAPLGGLSVDQFMQRHWQRRPALIRSALTREDLDAMPRERDLFALAARDHLSSRRVRNDKGRWHVDHGPFERLPSQRRGAWTLLVQGVDREVDAVHALMRRFRFISDARLDDAMFSYATDGGGVGPHLDSYDVFLIQVAGLRRWRIGARAQLRPRLQPDQPLKLLADFEAAQEWILEPGDILYLPPQWAHDGIAVGPCITCSIGFRTPTRHEFLSAWLADAADAPGGLDAGYRDPGAAATRHPARIPPALAARMDDWARSWRPDAQARRRFIGRYLTEPAAGVWFEPPEQDLVEPDFARMALREGSIRLDRRSRIAYRGRDLFLNGECFMGGAEAPLKRFADLQSLQGQELCAALGRPDCRSLLHRWWLDGWVACNTSPR